MHAPRVHDSNDAPELAIRRGEYSALAGPNMVNIHAPFGVPGYCAAIALCGGPADYLIVRRRATRHNGIPK